MQSALATLKPFFKPLDAYATELQRPMPSAEGLPGLVKSMVGVMNLIRDVPKMGYNKADKYPFLQSADVAAVLQDALVKNSLVITPREIEREIVGAIIFVKYQFDVFHEGGGYILNVATMSGSARFQFKAGTYDDKSIGKAITSVCKGCMVKLFSIPSDSSVDIEDDDNLGPRRGNETDVRHDSRNDPPRDQPRNDDRPRDTGRSQDPPPRNDSAASRDPLADRENAGGGGGLEPPFENTTGQKPAQAEESPHQAEVRVFQRKLAAAQNLKDADGVWADHHELVTAMADATYDHFVHDFKSRWNETPPK